MPKNLSLAVSSSATLSTPATATVAHAATPVASLKNDHFIVRDGVACAGVHLILDLYGANRLDDLTHMERSLRRAVEAARATLLHIHLHHFEENGGISGVAVLAESHISVHSWPERDYAAFDVFMCGDAQPEAAVAALREAFDAAHFDVRELKRGTAAVTPAESRSVCQGD